MNEDGEEKEESPSHSASQHNHDTSHDLSTATLKQERSISPESDDVIDSDFDEEAGAIEPNIDVEWPWPH